MPNWRIHLEIGKIIGKKIKYNKQDMQLYMLGNILPDINNGHIVKDISKVLSHEFTHYRSEKIAGYMNFYNLNKKNANNPIIVGFLVHLYTDFLFNRDFYMKKCLTDDKNKTHEELRSLKHSDFESYNNKFIDNELDIDNIEKAEEAAKIIDNVSVTEQDIKNVVTFLQTHEKSNKELSFYKTEELDELMENVIKKIEWFLRTLWIIRTKKIK